MSISRTYPKFYFLDGLKQLEKRWDTLMKLKEDYVDKYKETKQI